MKILVTVLAVASLATPVLAETWHPFSRSQNNAFMADVDSIVVNGAITSIRVATASRRGEAGDFSHSVETYEFECGANRWRTAGVVEYGADGAEAETFPEPDGAWETARDNTMPMFLKQIACDGIRAQPPHWPTVKAFIEAGRQ
ncbi:MAG TPA: surface-adhesin E family protein [Brevundimonas sp.]|nr:surface-adhesin E family protein [Brevundimonas sp.]